MTVSPTVSGRVYQLQRADNLGTGVWQNVGAAQSGTGGNLSLADTMATADVPQRFWRVQLSP